MAKDRRAQALVLVLAASVAALTWWSWLRPDTTAPRVVATAAPRFVAPTPQPTVEGVAAPAPRPAPAPEPLEPVVDGPVSFRVEVVDEAGRFAERAVVRPVACPGFAALGGSAFVADAGVCWLEATRRDGMLTARSEPVSVSLTAGRPATARLVLSSARTGGIGIRFLPADGGMRVVHVVDGGPAWEAGLEVGDLVFAVDGVALDGLPSEELVARMTGPEGTIVRFDVWVDDPEEPFAEPHVVTRRFLDDDR